MIDRKELKQNGRKSLKKNYWLFVAICLIAVFMGSSADRWTASVPISHR